MSRSFSTINGEKLYQGNFIPQKESISANTNDYVFAFRNSEILLIKNTIPSHQQFTNLALKHTHIKHIGKLGEKQCFAVELINNTNSLDSEVNLMGLRQAYNFLTDDFIKAAIYSRHIILWNKKSKYCGTCGNLTCETQSHEWVKECSNCKELYYPKISPAIIVAINNNGKLLMAQHKRMAADIFTVLAGFVSPGESLEECIHREVCEESGIEIKNIEYFGSQPWPFPDSLMIGFKAEYKSGKLKPDLNEINALKWFLPTEIPEWNNRSSIARALIDNFIEEHSH